MEQQLYKLTLLLGWCFLNFGAADFFSENLMEIERVHREVFESYVYSSRSFHGVNTALEAHLGQETENYQPPRHPVTPSASASSPPPPGRPLSGLLTARAGLAHS